MKKSCLLGALFVCFVISFSTANAATVTYYLYANTTGQVQAFDSLANLAIGNGTVAGHAPALGREGFAYDGTQFIMYDREDGQIETYASLNDLFAGNNTVLGNGPTGFEGLAYAANFDDFFAYDRDTGRIWWYDTLNDVVIGNPLAPPWNNALQGREGFTHDGTQFIMYDGETGTVETYATLTDVVSGNNNIIGFSSQTLRAGLTSVTTVPIPAAVWLFGSGLLGLVGIARRKKAA